MKKSTIFSIVVVICFASCVSVMFMGSTKSPLTGTLKTVTVTKTDWGTNRIERPQSGSDDQPRFKNALSYEEVRTYGVDQIITITNAQKLEELADTMKAVREETFRQNSMELNPMYRMEVIYADGTSNHFVFNRREWGGSGLTPPELLKFLDNNGL